MSVSVAANDSRVLLRLEEFLPYRLVILSARTSNAVARIYAERFQLTIPQWRIIATLGQYPVCTGRDIALHGMMHKSTVSRAVAALVKRGLLRKEPNAYDMREEHLRLTDEGRAIYEAVVPQARAFEEEITAAFDPAERKEFIRLIEKLDAHTRKLAPDHDPDA
ncbi:MAG: winged helix-turn-helix transcriptional regulator [Salinarimonas sp.]|nr:winged helix-turn-helix transcriptional regulator [Salinarimonas sp.]